MSNNTEAIAEYKKRFTGGPGVPRLEGFLDGLEYAAAQTIATTNHPNPMDVAKEAIGEK